MITDIEEHLRSSVFFHLVMICVKNSFSRDLRISIQKIISVDTQLISGVPYHEPQSNTHIEGLLVGLTCSF